MSLFCQLSTPLSVILWVTFDEASDINIDQGPKIVLCEDVPPIILDRFV